MKYIKDIVDGQANAPILEYTINFVQAGPLYMWARASHVDGYDDSFWIGLESLIEGTQPVSFTTDEQVYANEWYWIHFLMDGTTLATINIPSTGLHTLQVYMREPSFKIDKIVLVADEFYLPDDDDFKGPPETLAEASGIEGSQAVVPEAFELSQNYPNPFNPATTIRYALPKSEFVTLQICNLQDQEVERLVNSVQEAGDHQIKWTAQGLPSGIYFYRLQAGEFNQVKKMVLLQ